MASNLRSMGTVLSKAREEHDNSDDSTILGCAWLYSDPGAHHRALWRQYGVCQCRAGARYPPGAGCGHRDPPLGRAPGGQGYGHLCAAVARPLGPYPGLPVFCPALSAASPDLSRADPYGFHPVLPNPGADGWPTFSRDTGGFAGPGALSHGTGAGRLPGARLPPVVDCDESSGWG